MFQKKQDKSADDFWREYEETTGEKVLARTMGQYLSGWDEFDKTANSPLWGLAIVTSGGFRFHHFPQQNWLDAVFRSGAGTPKEKTLFIPKERIISAVLPKETKWWKKLLGPALSVLRIQYTDEDGHEKQLVIQTEFKTDGFLENLKSSACQCTSADSV